MIHALGLGQFQVGRSHECDWPPEVAHLPVCTQPRFDVQGDSLQIDQRVRDTLETAGSVYEIFTDLVDSLEPTHIFTQTQCRVCAVSLEDVQNCIKHSFRSKPQVIALEPTSLNGIWADIRRVAEACGLPAVGDKLIHSLHHDIYAIASRIDTSESRKGVVCLEWPAPLMAAGNWIPELVDLVHGRELLGTAGSYSKTITFDDLRRSDPEVLIFMCCGYGLQQTRKETRWLTETPHWNNLQAVQNDKVYLTDANHYMTRPGPRVLASLEALAQILHPKLFPPTLENIVWQKL